MPQLDVLQRICTRDFVRLFVVFYLPLHLVNLRQVEHVCVIFARVHSGSRDVVTRILFPSRISLNLFLDSFLLHGYLVH